MNHKIALKNLYKEYRTFTLGALSFCIPKGFVTGFIGPNGAGKTTTLKSLLSLASYEGEVQLEGDKITDLAYLQRVGIVMDEPFLSKDWDMRLVNKAMSIGYDHWQETTFYGYLSRFQIDQKLKVKELSRGMKIKLMLSIALSHGADLLILDEPTSGLDPGMRDELIDIIQAFMQEETHTVLFSTHITQDLEAIADYIVFLEAGKLIEACPKDDFMDQYRVFKAAPEAIRSIDPRHILGKKSNDLVTEILLHKAHAQDLGPEFIPDTTTIDKIMILYGRK